MITCIIPLMMVIMASGQVSARQITVVNSCGTTIWPGLFTGSGEKPSQATGWELTPGQKTQFEVSDTWTAGRVWARTGCVVQDGKFQCLTGSCGLGDAGNMECDEGKTNEPPATLAEFTLATDVDHFDISLVDGFNIPMDIHPSIDSCTSPSCPSNINTLCPPVLRTSIDQDGKNLGCLSPCNAGFGQEKYGNRNCCSGSYNDPTLCAICGLDYYHLFKDQCKLAYAYAYDEKSGTALWTCPSTGGKSADYTIEFCPSGSDYVGGKEAGTKYLSDTATCSNKATMGTQEFTVGPSPTKIATAGTLQVHATVATGLDGAAAIQITSSAGSATAAGSIGGTAVPTATAADAATGISTDTGVVIGGSSVTAVSATTDPVAAAAPTTTSLAGDTPPGTTAVTSDGSDAGNDVVTEIVTSTTVVYQTAPTTSVGAAVPAGSDTQINDAPTTAIATPDTKVSQAQGLGTATTLDTALPTAVPGMIAALQTDGGSGAISITQGGQWLTSVPDSHVSQRKKRRNRHSHRI